MVLMVDSNSGDASRGLLVERVLVVGCSRIVEELLVVGLTGVLKKDKSH